MPEDVGYFALSASEKLEAPIVITPDGIAIAGTAVPGVIISGEVYIDPVSDDLSYLRTLTIAIACEGGVFLAKGLDLKTLPDGRTQVTVSPIKPSAEDNEPGAGPPPPVVGAI